MKADGFQLTTKTISVNDGDSLSLRIIPQPYPDLNEQIDFYKDKARREMHQKIYRGLRFKGDRVFLLSPDERILREFDWVIILLILESRGISGSS